MRGIRLALLTVALLAGCKRRSDVDPDEIRPADIKPPPNPFTTGGKQMTDADMQQLFAQADAAFKKQAAAPKPLVAGDALDAPAPAGTLPVSISIETIGGVASVMFPRGTPLPAEHSETFSTAADDQPSVEVNVVQGERPKAADDRALGKFQLTGIPPARRGIPQIDVKFTLDAAGVLTVKAYDRATRQEKHITIAGQQSANAPDAIEALLADARAHHGDDVTAKAVTESRLRLDNLTHASRGLVSSARTIKLPPELLQELDAALTASDALLARDPSGLQLAQLQAAVATLGAVNQRIGEHLYANAAPMK